MLNEETSVTTRSNLLCPNGHDLQRVIEKSSDFKLACGCSRGELLPLTVGRVSIEHLHPFASKAEQRLGSTVFPASVESLKGSQRIWGRNAA